MALTKRKAAAYSALLNEELKAAMGCTEPIAIAYCAAYARKVLGQKPERYKLRVSGNLIKNTMAVTIPNTDGLRGMKAAVLAGALGGDPGRRLEVLAPLTDADRALLRTELEKDNVCVESMNTRHALHMELTVYAGGSSASVEIKDSHTNIVRVVMNGAVLEEAAPAVGEKPSSVRRLLNIKDILEYACTEPMEPVTKVLERQITCNCAIAEEGLRNLWGTGVGQAVLESREGTKQARLVAAPAAGSDARMNGCTMPVVINSGSGNQGMTVSLPVIEHAKAIGADHETLLRALCVSNLIALHEKASIGRLSAFCGAVSAAAASAAAIAWLDKQPYEIICQTIINALADVGGMICDGAKSSCAAKIATSLDTALLAYELARRNRSFQPSEGIVKGDVELTIRSVGRMASKGMHRTDREILDIMLGC